MPRRNEHDRDELRALAIQAVMELAEEKGADAVSARSVARRIGYTPGMLYHLFENRDELILHANAVTVDQLLAAVEKAADRRSPEKALEHICQQYLAVARDNGRRWELVFEHRMKDGQAVPDWYQARIDQLFAGVETQFRRLAPDRKPAELGLAARTLWSAVHGVCLLAISGKLEVGGTVNEKKVITSLVRNYIKGWMAS